MLPREYLPVRTSVGTPFSHASERGLGMLDRLPPELLYDIVLRLDMHSMFRLRQANRRGRQMADALSEYRAVVTHGLNLLCALLRTRLAAFVSLSDFYHSLCTRGCALCCGEFSGFMFLPTWTRCCFRCVQNAPETQVRSLASVRKQLGLSKAQILSLRPFRTFPGIYSMDESPYKSRITAVSLHLAGLLAGQPAKEGGQAPLADCQQRRNFNSLASCALPHYDKRTGHVERGLSCAGCQLAFEKGVVGTRRYYGQRKPAIRYILKVAF
ncbi:hypothetical protein N658DRAFT_494656 [Parathielavia hyrcaniae]|uniref:F-box domain-containing protein n=1 Tax=Parathielavia hyrcaniae TaxID=113614 RepID=A0AAN6Q4B0_9PEZI|nr:hypothetical protein N658DRAFT_494656 [Parathielavia hyrcaniae]